MAKSIGIFKKKADEEPRQDRKPAAKSPRGDVGRKGALSEALDELEAENVSESPKLFRQSDRPEDELIQFLDEKPKVAITEPEPPEYEEVTTRLVEPQVRKERVLKVPVRIGGSSAPAASEPTQASPIPKAEPAPAVAVAKSPEPREQHPAPQQAPQRKQDASTLEEDSIYEMIKSQTFARAKPHTTQRPPMRTDRPRVSQVQRQVLRAPAPITQQKPMAVEVMPTQPAEAFRARPEQPAAQTKRRYTAGAPILTQIKHDYLTLTLMVRWVEFLFERVTREKFPQVLDYYVEVGWMSEDVRSEVMAYARGEMQDVTKYMPREEEISDETPDMKESSVAVYKKVDDWRLSADDHLKSLLFISKMAGIEVDKDKLNSLEQSIKRFKENLEGFYGV